MKKILIFVLCLAITVSCCALNASAAFNFALTEIKTYSEILLLISLDDGSVIIEKNADMKTAPASLTKIVTAVLILEECKDLNEMVTVKQYTIDMFNGTGSSMAGLKVGEEMSVLNLLYCLLVRSGNEASAILADYLCGNIEDFVGKMNSFVREIGCENTNFVNPHGLDEPNQYTTANDMQKIVSYALKFDIFEKITNAQQYIVPATNMSGERTLQNTNFMLNKSYADYYCAEASGIKTGSTGDAGRCVISKASKNGYNFLGIVMRGPMKDIDGDKVLENCAFVDCKAMFKWATANIRLTTIAEAGQVIKELPLNYSSSNDYIRLVPAEEVNALVPAGTNSGSVLIRPVKDSLPESVDAPVKAGQAIGKAEVVFAGEVIAVMDLVAEKDVGRNVFLYIGGVIKKASSTLVFKLIAAVLILVIAAYVTITILANLKQRRKNKLRLLKYQNKGNDKKR